jgi:hypothetical protein
MKSTPNQIKARNYTKSLNKTADVNTEFLRAALKAAGKDIHDLRLNLRWIREVKPAAMYYEYARIVHKPQVRLLRSLVRVLTNEYEFRLHGPVSFNMTVHDSQDFVFPGAFGNPHLSVESVYPVGVR